MDLTVVTGQNATSRSYWIAEISRLSGDFGVGVDRVEQNTGANHAMHTGGNSAAHIPAGDGHVRQPTATFSCNSVDDSRSNAIVFIRRNRHYHRSSSMTKRSIRRLSSGKTGPTAAGTAGRRVRPTASGKTGTFMTRSPTSRCTPTTSAGRCGRYGYADATDTWS